MTRVSYQGTHGSFSHQAGQQYFASAYFRGCQTFTDAIELVKNGDCDYAMIPVDNSTAGRISEVYNLLPNAGLLIVGECFIPIHFCLMMPAKAVKGSPSENMSKEELIIWKNREPNTEEIEQAVNRITDLYTHHQGLILCEDFIKQTFKQIKVHETWDTAGAARDLALNYDPNSAALAPLAATRYDMTVLKAKVEDDQNSTTRFLVLAKKPLAEQELKEDLVTSLMFQTKNQAGALFAALEVFKRFNLNITKLETYMMGVNHSQPHFYLDLERKHRDNLNQVLSELKTVTLNVKMLGTYNKA